jgi:hypothetical protein
MTSEADASSTYVPTGDGDGWLCFEGLHSKRRLTEFPERWAELSDPELDALCETAKPAQRSQRILGLEPDVEAPRSDE